MKYLQKIKYKLNDFAERFNLKIIELAFKLVILMVYLIFKIVFGFFGGISYLIKKNPSIVVYIAVFLTILILFFI